MEPLKPYERLPEAIWYKGATYALDLSYAAFFAACDASQDLRLSPRLRVKTALRILVKDSRCPVDPGLLQAIMDLLKDDRPRPDGPQTLDVVQDWPYVCAAFQQAYGIDLYADKSIHILRFRALLQAIPKSTKLSEIIGIRAAKVPAPNRHNQDQIAELLRLKAHYALRRSGPSAQEGWRNLFNLLEQRAKHG